MFVLGTAGHIDHGKSSLINALTGIDPDRLPEEKERGMTIDLGFAWLDLPDGDVVGLVDVPGHERFVRNMVAGAGGINAAMLVIAADDGWMPQTQEHFDILKLLDIKHGLVALTKIDLVEPDWVELIRADIREKLQGSFLAEAPIIPVSSVTGENVDKIAEAVKSVAVQIRQVEDIAKARLFVDRAFILTGIGVVATGTGRGGSFRADQEVYHFPSGEKTRIRTLQSHEKKVEFVPAGRRIAMNLAGLDRSEVKRGDVICGNPYPENPRYFAVSITNLPNSIVNIDEGRRVLIIHGTTETEAVARPFAKEGIKPGYSGLAVIKTDLPLAVFLSDRFILRLPTPQVTIGGGIILDILGQYTRRKDLSQMDEYLETRRGGQLRDFITTELNRRLFTPRSGFLDKSNFSWDAINSEFENLQKHGISIAFNDYLALAERIDSVSASVESLLQVQHRKHPYTGGLTGDELKRGLKDISAEDLNILLEHLQHGKKIVRTNQYYHLPGFNPAMDAQMEQEANKIMACCREAGHSYLTYQEIESKFPGSSKTVSFLRNQNRLKAIDNKWLIPSETWREIIEFMELKLKDNGRIAIAEFRDHFDTTRKYALPVLEYFDNRGVTRRDGDFRIKGNKYNERHSV